jgi:hydroxymethylglutaryl-CoA lyase
MAAVGVPIISLADTVGLATPDQVLSTTRFLVDALPQTTIGVHLHSTESQWQEKVQAALEAGCRRFDGALRGIGGCPLSGNALVGNMNTERMVAYFQERGWMNALNQSALQQSLDLANRLFV